MEPAVLRCLCTVVKRIRKDRKLAIERLQARELGVLVPLMSPLAGGYSTSWDLVINFRHATQW